MNSNERVITIIGTILLVLFFTGIQMLATAEGCILTCNPITGSMEDE